MDLGNFSNQKLTKVAREIEPLKIHSFMRSVMLRDWGGGLASEKKLGLSPSCVTLGKLVTLSELFFLFVKWG